MYENAGLATLERKRKRSCKLCGRKSWDGVAGTVELDMVDEITPDAEEEEDSEEAIESLLQDDEETFEAASAAEMKSFYEDVYEDVVEISGSPSNT